MYNLVRKTYTGSRRLLSRPDRDRPRHADTPAYDDLLAQGADSPPMEELYRGGGDAANFTFSGSGDGAIYNNHDHRNINHSINIESSNDAIHGGGGAVAPEAANSAASLLPLPPTPHAQTHPPLPPPTHHHHNPYPHPHHQHHHQIARRHPSSTATSRRRRHRHRQQHDEPTPPPSPTDTLRLLLQGINDLVDDVNDNSGGDASAGAGAGGERLEMVEAPPRVATSEYRPATAREKITIGSRYSYEAADSVREGWRHAMEYYGQVETMSSLPLPPTPPSVEGAATRPRTAAYAPNVVQLPAIPMGTYAPVDGIGSPPLSSPLSSSRCRAFSDFSIEYSEARKLQLLQQRQMRPIRYGTGRYADLELSPQPSDGSDDPLNWPQWKKELNLVSLIFAGALAAASKTAFIPVHSEIALQYGVSYTAAASLTAAPLVVSAFLGYLSQVLGARMWKKRPVYLISLLLLLIGVALNAAVGLVGQANGREIGMGEFNKIMAGRVLQGMGWGAFDVLILTSIQDTYFEHERKSRIDAHSIITFVVTWGSPLLGGWVSERSPSLGFALQFRILAGLLALAAVLVVLAAPETAYDRRRDKSSSVMTGNEHISIVEQQTSSSRYSSSTTTSGNSSNVESILPFSTGGAVSKYLRSLCPWSSSTPRIQLSHAFIQVARASVAPTTLLLFASNLLPHAGLWGFASVVALLFSPLPFLLTPASIGVLFTGPVVLGLAVGLAVALIATVLPRVSMARSATPSTPYSRRLSSMQQQQQHQMLHRELTPRTQVVALAGASLVATAGLWGFGLYCAEKMTLSTDGASSTNNTQWTLNLLSVDLSFPVVSLLLGLIAAGSVLHDSTSLLPAIRRSTSFTSPSLISGLQSGADMHAGVVCLRNLFAGLFVLFLPGLAWSWDGLRMAAIGIGIGQLIGGLWICGGVWWAWGEELEGVRKWDGKVMGLVDVRALMRQGSWFDDDHVRSVRSGSLRETRDDLETGSWI